MNSTKVSIITVSYNAEQTIEQTIKSVLNQTYKNIEYIIIDGASTDSTCQIINKYQSYINTIVSEKDEGLYYAMNKGISYAQGDIIGILNSDDTYVEEAVSKVVEYYQKTDADVIFGNALHIKQEKEVGIQRCDNIEGLWYGMVIPHPATFVKAAAYKMCGGFNTKYQIAADYELMLRFYCNHLRFGHVDKVIAYFRVGGVSCQNQKVCMEEAKEVALCYINQCSRKDYYLKKIYDKYYESYLGYLWKNERQMIEKGISVILSNLSVKNIVIWGTGKWGQRIGSFIQNLNVKIDFFIDNDESKQYESVRGRVTKSPEFLKDYAGVVWIAVSIYSDIIIEQIRKINGNLFILTLADIGRCVVNETGAEQILNKLEGMER